MTALFSVLLLRGMPQVAGTVTCICVRVCEREREREREREKRERKEREREKREREREREYMLYEVDLPDVVPKTLSLIL